MKKSVVINVLYHGTKRSQWLENNQESRHHHRLNGIQFTYLSVQYYQHDELHRLDGFADFSRARSRRWYLSTYESSFNVRREHAIHALEFIRDFNSFDNFERYGRLNQAREHG